MQQDIEAARTLSTDTLNCNPGPTPEIHPGQGATQYAPEMSSSQTPDPLSLSLPLSLSVFHSLKKKTAGRLNCCRAFQDSAKADEAQLVKRLEAIFPRITASSGGAPAASPVSAAPQVCLLSPCSHRAQC